MTQNDKTLVWMDRTEIGLAPKLGLHSEGFDDSVEPGMTISVLKFNREICATIRDARRQGALSLCEADYLLEMAANSPPACSTMTLVTENGVPDFLYAALYFSTHVWMSGETAGHEAHARAGYKLAYFSLQKADPSYDHYWASNLLRELCNAHADSVQRTSTAA